MFKLEPRPQVSRFWTYGAPILALLITVAVGVCLFAALGKDPVKGLQAFFWEPIKTSYALGELVMKATPLLLIALGLAVCFRSNIWNIGAEGQFVIGAVTAGGVALLADKTTGPWIVPAILLAGVLGGMVWAGIVALLRDRFNANEILVSLMLVYVGTLVLGYLVYGPWKDPMGYNFPQTKSFERVTQIPRLVQGMRMNIGVIISLVGAGLLRRVHLPLVAQGLQAGNAALERGLVAHRAGRGVDVDVPGAVRVIAVIVAAVVGVVRHSGRSIP